MLKDAVQKLANRLGYRISKIRRRPDVAPIDVLDLVIHDYLRRADQMYVVQVGANDGSRADPVNQYIRRYHWRGLLIEPQPRVFERLVQTYADEPQLAFEQCLVGREEGEQSLYTVRESADGPSFRWTGLARLDRESLVAELAGEGFENPETFVEELRVPVATLNHLLEKHDVSHVDYLQIDAEGFDFEIIKTVDFERFGVPILQYEHFHLSEDDRIACMELLSRHGYRLAGVRGDTVAYREPD